MNLKFASSVSRYVKLQAVKNPSGEYGETPNSLKAGIDENKLAKFALMSISDH